MMRDYLYRLATDKEKGLIASGIKAVLCLLSLIYGLAVVSLAFFYRLKPCRLNCKVISVGNLTLGGTGKTLLVEAIARYLRLEGHRVAILSRGYRRRVKGQDSEVKSYENMGDEPFMLSRKLGDIPVIVDRDRIKGARQAVKEFGADTVILDDGMQQWRIKKDLEIVTIDATQPFGNRWLIPRGILREPLSALARADIFVLTKTNLASDSVTSKECLNKFFPQALVVESAHAPVGFFNIRGQDFLAPEALESTTAGLFSGIADPDSFEQLVLGLKVKIAFSLRFPDHHHYGREDLKNIIFHARQKNIATILTTEKDVSRLTGLKIEDYGIKILFLRINLEIIDEQRLYNRILSLYSA